MISEIQKRACCRYQSLVLYLLVQRGPSCHPGICLSESGRRTRSEGSREEKDGCRRTHRGARAAAIRAADVAG